MKTNKEILEQEYMTAKDLQQIIPVNYVQALEYIRDAQNEMKEKGYLVPKTKEKIALTKIIKRSFGL